MQYKNHDKRSVFGAASGFCLLELGILLAAIVAIAAAVAIPSFSGKWSAAELGGAALSMILLSLAMVSGIRRYRQQFAPERPPAK
jgi:Tfp pilus assembly protein FimT